MLASFLVGGEGKPLLRPTHAVRITIPRKHVPACPERFHHDGKRSELQRCRVSPYPHSGIASSVPDKLEVDGWLVVRLDNDGLGYECRRESNIQSILRPRVTDVFAQKWCVFASDSKEPVRAAMFCSGNTSHPHRPRCTTSRLARLQILVSLVRINLVACLRQSGRNLDTCAMFKPETIRAHLRPIASLTRVSATKPCVERAS